MADSRNRTFVAIAISLAALAVMVGALWPRGETVRTDAERVDHIASRMRCPFCSGESIADATAQVARDLEVVIEEQVAAGMTDDEIFAFFADRYGESLLLDPPLFGWGWALWVLPLAALGVGAFAVVRRRRNREEAEPIAAADSLEAARLRERLEYVARDRDEIAIQEARGEIDRGTAVALATTLDAEARALSAALEATDEAGYGAASGLVRNRRVWAGAGVLLVGAVAVAATLLLSADGSGEGGIVDAPPIDLASITTERLEEVVAANPDVIPMRLALGQMLMDEGEVARAAMQFGEVLQREDNPEAMAWLGWISFLAEQHDMAENFLVDALAIEPDYPQAQWWLANVRLLGLGDAAGAITPLEHLLESPGVPDDVRVAAEGMLERAREES